MDFSELLTIIIISFLIFSLISCCCRRKVRGVIYSTPVVVTTTTTEARPVPVPYPTQVITPAVVTQTAVNYQMPQPAYIANQNVATPPYPVGNQGMPQPQGYSQQPPSYDQVQSHESLYTKQPPYNPNFTG